MGQVSGGMKRSKRDDMQIASGQGSDDDLLVPSPKRLKLDVTDFIFAEDIPPIHTLKELVNASEAGVVYNNIDMTKLWNVGPEVKLLDRMVGLEDVKSLVLRQIKYYIGCWRETDDDYLHTKITGDPGTGKTTLAEILAKIYCHLGVLSTGKVVRGTREKMIGKYLGQTAPKVKEIVDEAKGGVLLLDEAYSFGCGENEDLYSVEFVNTLNRLLSENKKDFICIIVGYQESLERRLFSLNEGFSRRFANHIDTGETTPDTLMSIMYAQAEQAGWKIARDVNIEFFTKNKEYFDKGGGSTELLLSKCKLAYSDRTFGTPQTERVITKSDVLVAFDEYKYHNVSKEIKKELPGMYM
jgi:hypothetical protein